MTSSSSQPSRVIPVLIVLAALSALVLIILITPYGPGLRDDSFTYLSAAEFLTSNGQYARPSAMGRATPISNFPPAYSLLLTIPIFLRADPITAARIVNAILFSALIISSGYLVNRVSKRIVLIIVAVGLISTASELILQFTWAQSEPLFLSLIPVLFLLLFSFLRSAGNKRYLIATAIVLSIASLTRYSGFSLIIASILMILLIPYSQVKDRIKHAVFLAISSSLLTSAFLLRNFILIGNLTNRPSPYWHPPETNSLLLGFHEILMWFIPDRFILDLDLTTAGIILLGLASALGLANFWVFRSERLSDPEHKNAKLILKIIFIHLIVYALFILGTLLFLDVLTPLNDRILSPLRLMLTLEIIFLGQLISCYRPPLGLRVSNLIFGALLAFQAYRSIHLIKELRAEGQGYSESIWRESEALSFVCQLPQVPIYADDLPAVYFHCNRLAQPIPFPTNLASQVPNNQYLTEMEALRKDLKDNDGYLVILGWYGEARIKQLNLTSLIEDLRVEKGFDDGLILSY